VLLQLGASPNQPGPLNYTPLQYACRWDCRDIGALLIQNKAQVDTADEDGWTPLHWACASDAMECISLLVLAGAAQTVCDKFGMRPVDVASEAGRVVIFQSTKHHHHQQQGQSVEVFFSPSPCRRRMRPYATDACGLQLLRLEA
jgi:ankyrin repeat protein